MTRLELAKKRAKELEKKQSNVTNKENMQSTSNTSKTNKRLELAKQRATEVENEYKKAQEQQQAWNDYVSKNGVDKINSDYSKYMKSVNNTLAPKLSQTDSMQNILAKKNVITPSQMQDASEALTAYKTKKGIEEDKTSNENNRKRTVEYDDSLTKFQENDFKVFQKMRKTAQDEGWANSKNSLKTAVAGYTGLEKEKQDRTLFKMPENLKDNLRYFEDGYQFGDLTKSSFETQKELAKDLLSTGAEGAIDFTKGVLSVSEDIANTGASTIAFGADLIGQDDFANALRKKIAKGSPFTSLDNVIDDASEWYNKNSFTGDLLDSANEGIGQTWGQLAVGARLGKIGNVPIKFGNHVLNIPTTAFLVGWGNSASETYAEAEQQLNGIENATWREKAQMALRTIRGGVIEGVTEGMFGMLGVGGSDITDEWAKKAMAQATSSYEKQLIKVLYSGGGEAVEEFVSYSANWLFDNGFINKLGNLDLTQDYNWEEVFEEMASAFISFGISQGGTSITQINQATKNAISEAEQMIGRELTAEEKTEIKNNITDIVLEAKEELKETVKMYPAKQSEIDYANIEKTVNKNNEYLRNKYGIKINEENVLFQKPELSNWERLKQKFQIKHDNYDKPIVQSKSNNVQKTNKNVQKQTKNAQKQAKNVQGTSDNVQNVSDNTNNNAQNTSDNTQTLTNTAKSFQDIIKSNSTIQGLEDYSEQDIKNIVSDYVENLDSDVKIKNVKLNLNQENGLNATIEYDGNISQEELTDILNQEPLTIDGVKININAEDLNVFEENKRYDNVDIIEESDYNRYTTNQKANKISNKISNNEKAQVASEALQWRQDEADGIHYIDLSAKGYKSYVYNKTGNDIQTLLRIDGAEDFKNYIRKGVEDGTYKKSTSLDGWIANIKSEYRRHSNDNDVLSNGRNSKTNDRTHIKSIRQQRRNNNGEITTKSSRNELIENSEQSSFSLPKNQDTVEDNSQDYEYTNEKEKLHIERAEEIFGYTDDFEKAGYLTWDGNLLDFSDGSDRRIEDHRAINQVFDETFDSNSDYLIKFMNEGNIRISPEIPGIEISNFTEPSNAQLDMIEEYAEWNKYDGYFVVDFCNKYGDNIGSLEYENNINPSQIIDDINEFFRTGELPNVEETNKQYDNQITIEDNLRTKMYYKLTGNKPVVVAQRYWNGFEKKGYIDLNGKTVRDAQDVAELSQIFRNPQYETARMIYVKGNTIVGQEAVSSHLPNSSAVFTDKNRSKAFYKIEDRMKRLNADGYYMVHNHPSGVAKASQQDINVTKTVSNNVKGFKGHIIVDHGTYAYISKGLDGDITYKNELKVDDKNALYKGSTFETALPTDKIPWSERIDSREDFASLMYNLKNSPNYSSLILSDSNNKINAIIDVPNGFFNMRTNHVEGYIRNVAKQYGATKAFIGTSNSEVFDRLKQLSILQDAILYKDNQKQFADKGNKIFETNNRSVAVRTAEETKDERIERVRKYIEEFQQGMGTLGVKVNRKEIIEKIIDNYGITTKGNSKELDKVSTEIQKLLEDGALTDKKIEGYAEYLIDNLKVTVDDFYSANKELKELIRNTKLYASDTVKNGFGDWTDFRKRNIGTLRLTNDENALPIDTFYRELTEIYGETFFPSDIANMSDQLERISEVAKQIKIIDQTLRENIKDNFGEEAIQEIQNGLVQNLKTWRDKMAQENSENTDENSKPDKIKKRSYIETLRGNEMVDKFLNIEDMDYAVMRNQKALNEANNILDTKGYEKALNYFESVIESHKIASASDVVLGERLIQETIKKR